MDTSKIDTYISIGMKDKDWYAECEELFVRHYGVKELKLVAEIFAATSINSSLKSNIRLFRKAYHEIKNGLPFSNYLPVMRMQLDRIRAGEPIRGQKISAFSAAISGDHNAVVVDTWLLRAFDMDRQYQRKLSGRKQSGGATEKQFPEVESWVRSKALEMGLQARQLSAIIWCGVRVYYTGDKETHYKNILEHQLFNMFQ